MNKDYFCCTATKIQGVLGRIYSRKVFLSILSHLYKILYYLKGMMHFDFLRSASDESTVIKSSEGFRKPFS